MVNTTLAALGFGDKIALSPGGENRIPALGSTGTVMKAGNIVGIADANGRVAGTDLAAVDVFHGILDKRYDTDIDTAITQDAPCSVIVPKSGNKYLIRVTDPAAGLATGVSLTWSATAGTLVKTSNLATTLERNIAIIVDLALVSGDTVAIIRWL